MTFFAAALHIYTLKSALFYFNVNLFINPPPSPRLMLKVSSLLAFPAVTTAAAGFFELFLHQDQHQRW